MGRSEPGGLEEGLASVLEIDVTGIRPGETGGDGRGGPDEGRAQRHIGGRVNGGDRSSQRERSEVVW